MATNILLLLATCLLVGYCTAGLIPEHATAIISHPVQLDESPPQYEFHYSVHDSHTGDIKDQFEHRRGDYVTGRYSLIEPDGQRRIVDYSADPLLGFTAQVRRELPVIRSFPIGAQLHAVAGRRSDDGTQNVEKWPADESDRR